MKIRTSTKAIILRDDQILLQENRDAEGLWYLLPGGGQEHGEALPDALRRECREEIGAEVTVGPLRFVRDYIGANHEFAATNGEFHQVEFLFLCTIPADYVPTEGHTPDLSQVGVRWIRLDQLNSVRFYPKALIPYLTEADLGNGAGVAYLGDVN